MNAKSVTASGLSWVLLSVLTLLQGCSGSQGSAEVGGGGANSGGGGTAEQGGAFVTGEGGGTGGAAGAVPVLLASQQSGALHIAVDATSVYWTDRYAGAVMKVLSRSVNGGVPQTLASEGSRSGIWDLAVDGTSVYWTTFDPVLKTGAVMTVPIGGGTPKPLATPTERPAGIALDATNVYWIGSGAGLSTVMSVSKGGGTPIALAQAIEAGDPIAVDATNVYWVTLQHRTSSAGLIMAVPVGGGTSRLVAPSLSTPYNDPPSPEGLATDGTNVYWTVQYSRDSMGYIVTAPIGGGDPTVLCSGAFAPRAITVDDASVYWTNYPTADTEGSIMKIAKTGGIPSVLATNQAAPEDIVVDATSVYWTNGTSPNGVMRLTPK